jgi:hypothetical protein
MLGAEYDDGGEDEEICPHGVGFDEECEECAEEPARRSSPSEELAANCPRMGCIFCRGQMNPDGITDIKSLSEQFIAELANPALAEQRRNAEVWPIRGAQPKYEEHIQSEWWFHARHFVIRDAEEAIGCDDCGITQSACWKKYGKGYQVHHKTYARMGNEHPDDLVALCPQCHAKRHNKPTGGVA